MVLCALARKLRKKWIKVERKIVAVCHYIGRQKKKKEEEGLLAESHDLRHSTLYFLRAHCTDVYASTSQKISFAFFITTVRFSSLLTFSKK